MNKLPLFSYILQAACIFRKHLSYFRESYIWPLVGVAFLLLAMHGVEWLTGRPLLDSPEQIIGAIYNIIVVLFVVAIIGAMKGHILPDVDEDNPEVPWQKVAVDAASTIIPLCALCWLVLH